MTVSCERCGEVWPRDPALEVECPQCHAPIGSPCMRPSGHRVFGGRVHSARDQRAMDEGLLKRCSGKPNAGPNLSND